MQHHELIEGKAFAASDRARFGPLTVKPLPLRSRTAISLPSPFILAIGLFASGLKAGKSIHPWLRIRRAYIRGWPNFSEVGLRHALPIGGVDLDHGRPMRLARWTRKRGTIIAAHDIEKVRPAASFIAALAFSCQDWCNLARRSIENGGLWREPQYWSGR